MKFDWITFGIWIAGFAVLIIWIIQSAKEFKEIFLGQRKEINSRKKEE
jgi:hypothetical protein